MFTRRETFRKIADSHSRSSVVFTEGPSDGEILSVGSRSDNSPEDVAPDSLCQRNFDVDDVIVGGANSASTLRRSSTRLDEANTLGVTVRGITYVASLREELWQSVLGHLNQKHYSMVQLALECLSQTEPYWGASAVARLESIKTTLESSFPPNYIGAIKGVTDVLTSLVIKVGQSQVMPVFCVLVVCPPYTHYSTEGATNVVSELKSALRSSTKGKLSYQIVEVDNAYEALLAVLVNPEILAVVIQDDVPAYPISKNHSSSLEGLDNFVMGIEKFAELPLRSISAGRPVLPVLVNAMKTCRAALDIYAICNTLTVSELGNERDKIERCFASLEDHSELHETILAGIKKKQFTPFFEALKAYSEKPIGVFHALAISRGNSIRVSRWIGELGDFYGTNLFKAESSSTCGGLDSLLDPHGALKEAQLKAAKAFGAAYVFFTTNGTSASNKITVQALTKPNDVVIIDRSCHKSHHYAFVMQGVRPCYLDGYALHKYSMFGGVTLTKIKRMLLLYRKEGRLDEVSLLILTNCTFDGIVYNVKMLIEECLAIHPKIAFLFDEAWFAYAGFHPILRNRTGSILDPLGFIICKRVCIYHVAAMHAANSVRHRLFTGGYNSQYQKLCNELGVENLEKCCDIDRLLTTRLYPDRKKAVVRVYATQSTHKSLTSLRQGSMILCNDDLFESDVHTAFKEAYYAHMSTSPNYQILATMDVGRAQMELEGCRLVERQIEAALKIRQLVNRGRASVRRNFRILTPCDMLPDIDDPSVDQSDFDLQMLETSWLSDDFFVLDPTRLTFFTGEAGIDGETFKVQWLMNKYGIQVNKTSRNSVLFQTNIGTDRSSCIFLAQCLEKAANEVDMLQRLRCPREEELHQATVRSLVVDYPELPFFSSFHPAFVTCQNKELPDGDIRTPFYLAYDDNNCVYYMEDEAIKLIESGRLLVASTFIIPYPPGFPVTVPGQVLNYDILRYLQMLDVKEIHGYDRAIGLRCFKDEVLNIKQTNK